ncbi:hypothetical protein [Embleya sp. NPDC050493]|uniref:hypothetical protein n=1 Tax=Embleya sp. NPDC050493 TaxID=3363989 RepID=UPI0037A15B9F
MDHVEAWTGEKAVILQRAMRLSNAAFADHLGMAVRTVAGWHAQPAKELVPTTQAILDTALHRAEDSVHARFRHMVSGTKVEAHNSERRAAFAAAEERLISAPHASAALAWLDHRMRGEPTGTARRRAATHLASLDTRALHDRTHQYGDIQREATASALAEYYSFDQLKHGLYATQCEGAPLKTSIVTMPRWLDISLPVASESSRFNFLGTSSVTPQQLPAFAIDAAVGRLCEVVVRQTRLVNAPIYRLLSSRIQPGFFEADFALTEFVEYALTMDLLEQEMMDALVDGRAIKPGSLPLRDFYMGDTSSLLNLRQRLCAGGTLALCAFARPARARRGSRADYLLLIQERGGKVLNASRRLSVIPKAFHGPLVDFAEDTHIAATLEREMEEELFGRGDVDSTESALAHADPMHPNRLSAPMRWLTEHPDHWRMEHTGFGINCMSGNYEFATLLVIEDEKWWEEFGGEVRANWESSGLRRYSSRDRRALTELAHDPAWSNEGLFALMQGFRRLSETGGDRVDMPNIELRL